MKKNINNSKNNAANLPSWGALLTMISHKAMPVVVLSLFVFIGLGIFYSTNYQQASALQLKQSELERELEAKHSVLLDEQAKLQRVEQETKVLIEANRMGLQPSLDHAYALNIPNLKPKKQ
ncbi:MAG: hypothetical protein EBX41_01110 [Chitinophagia bacterium]|nr:hypothetical protein [Chitinophagia bacterium]